MAPDKRLQEEIRKVIQVLAARYGSEVMLHLQLIPSGNTCRVLWNGTLIETIKVLEGNDTHFSFSNESKRKYKIKGKKPFSTLLGAVLDIMESTKTDNVESVDEIVKRVIDKYGAPLKIDIIIWTRRVIGGQETLVQYVYIKEKDNGGT